MMQLNGVSQTKKTLPSFKRSSPNCQSFQQLFKASNPISNSDNLASESQKLILRSLPVTINFANQLKHHTKIEVNNSESSKNELPIMSKNGTETSALKKFTINSINPSNNNNSCNSNETLLGGNGNLVIYSSSNSYSIKMPDKANCMANSMPINRVKIEPDLESEEIQVSLNPKIFFNSNEHLTDEHSYNYQINDVNISKTNDNHDFIVGCSNSAASSFVSIVNHSNNSYNESLPEKIFDTDNEDEDDDDEYLCNTGTRMSIILDSINSCQNFKKPTIVKLEPELDENHCLTSLNKNQPNIIKTNKLDDLTKTTFQNSIVNYVLDNNGSHSSCSSKHASNFQTAKLMSNYVEMKNQVISINKEVVTKNNIKWIDANKISTSMNNNLNDCFINTDSTTTINSKNIPSYSKLLNSKSALNHLLPTTKNNKYTQLASNSLYAKDNNKLTRKTKLIQGSDGIILKTLPNYPETLKDHNNVISMNIKKRLNHKTLNDNNQECISKKEIRRRKIWKQLLIDIKMKTPRFRSTCSDRQFQMKTIAVNCQNHYSKLNKHMKNKNPN